MYRGRFAPTISGPLHFGSLITAVASYLDAKAHDGQWLLQIDDLDQPRVPPEAESQILFTLESHGLIWDEEPLRQTDHLETYLERIQKLRSLNLLFYCTCTRRQRPVGKPYPGTCRNVTEPPNSPHAIRIRTDEKDYEFLDRIQGLISRTLQEVGGDFVIYRRDGIAGYPLTAVTDDATTQISHVLRGSDLVENSINQLYLIEKLGFETPTYAHVAVLNEKDGIKLSKRNAVVAVDDSQSRFNLRSAMQLLGMDPPQQYGTHDLLKWGTANWDIERLPKEPALSSFIST